MIRLEFVAALLAVVYLLLAIRQHVGCWVAAFVSSCLYVYVMFGARLYMEAALNAFYAAMAGYGYWQWTHGREGGVAAVTHWSWPRNAAALVAVAALSLFSSYFLRRYTAAAWPLVDSLTAWASVFATYLVARKVYENWHWWLVIDAVSLWLCYLRGLYTTMLLFAVYIVMIVFGMREWRRSAREPLDDAQHA